VKGIVIPDRETDFTADPVELFFDLVFVFAFSQLVYHLIDTPGWAGFGQFVLLFLMIWMPWTQFTWSANAVSGNTRPVRVLVLIATVASVPMAGSATAAFEDGGPAFAVSLGIILAMGLLVMIIGLPAGTPERRAIAEYSIPNWTAIVVIVVGSLFDDAARIVLWAVGLSIVVWGTIRAGRNQWLVRPKHFAERHGLIVIVALGEVIVALGIPVVATLSDDDGRGLPIETIGSLMLAGVFACLLWWGYFDRPLPALEHRHGQHDDPMPRGRYARDVYTYLHAPIVGGVVMSAAALEEITLHPTDPLPATFRWLLAAGLALYLLGVVAAVYRAFAKVPLERVIGAVAITVVVAALANVDGLILLAAVDVVLVALLLTEHSRVERKSRG
jgi:low temperature requirement protein LtrA